MPRLPHPPRSYAPIWLITALLALFVGACGFQPRGTTTDSITGVPSPLSIVGIGRYSDLYRELEQRLKVAGVDVAESGAAGTAVLRISAWRRDTRLLSVNSRNRAVEFELEELAEFTMHTSDGRELVAPQAARVTRIQFRPETAVLGSAREAEMLREDMLRELAERIVRRLAAQH